MTIKVFFNPSGLSTDSVKDAFREAAKVPLGHECDHEKCYCGEKGCRWDCICGQDEQSHAPINPSEVEALLSREDYMKEIIKVSY